MKIDSLFYDSQDRFFLKRVNETIENIQNSGSEYSHFMHPNGIIELTSSQEFRMASAILCLLDNLSHNDPERRLQALENLHTEVLLTGRTKFRRNTARVLIEIIKEIVRAYGDEDLQLQLIHDFRMAATGKPNIVRKFLKRYYLLEMPESWNQLVFDHHVHDANTKGRKSPTQLIMDAWVKGIKSLTVIYYHYVSEEAGSELIRAAQILDIKIRIGILCQTVYNHKLLDFIWVPQGFSNLTSFRYFIKQPKIAELMQEGKVVSKWKEQFIFNILRDWNDEIRHKISNLMDFEFLPIEQDEFLDYVAIGQASIMHLAELIHKKHIDKLYDFVNGLKKEISELKEISEVDNKENIADLNFRINSFDRLTPEFFLQLFEYCEDVQKKNIISKIIAQESDVPFVLNENPFVLVSKLSELSTGNSITLNLADLTPEDVLNLLWDCQGLITHLEIFNVNDWHKGELIYTKEMNSILQAINNENSPNLKLIIQTVLEKCQLEENVISNFWGLKLDSENSELFKNESLADGQNEKQNQVDGQSVYSEQVQTKEQDKDQDIIQIDGQNDKDDEQLNSENSIISSIILNEAEKSIELEQQAEKSMEELFIKIENEQNSHLTAKENNDIENWLDFEKLLPKEEINLAYKSDERFILISQKDRVNKLRNILKNIVPLIGFYRSKKLLTRMGTDSTSRISRLAGMGLAYAVTLPTGARKELKNRHNNSRLRLPVRKEINKVYVKQLPQADENIRPIIKFLRLIPIIREFTYKKDVYYNDSSTKTFVQNDGSCTNDTINFGTDQGNIVTLGGVGAGTNNNFTKIADAKPNPHTFYNLNTNIKNVLKLLIGFIPAFFSFQYTQNIEFLAWFGAIIWFFITGFRNILQAVLGGGGVHRSPLLRWNNYVSWTRLCDSLMYTGISVVLLELCVRTLLLTQTFNITSTNSPYITFTVISLLNGCYIVTHNIIRGLQAEAIFGNFFRSFLAIPIALLYNSIFNFLLLNFEFQDVNIILQSSSAILSKLASDTVAGVIEGSADKGSFIWFRNWDYKFATKIMYKNYSQLEVTFPEKDAMELLKNPEVALEKLKYKNQTLYNDIIVNALDFMAFHYYQPRAVSTLKNIINNLSDTERIAWLRLQSVLKCQKEVSQLFIDGVFGINFSKALAFYLDKHEQYLLILNELYKTRVEIQGNKL